VAQWCACPSQNKEWHIRYVIIPVQMYRALTLLNEQRCISFESSHLYSSSNQ
jgi:hypothetical protein